MHEGKSCKMGDVTAAKVCSCRGGSAVGVEQSCKNFKLEVKAQSASSKVARLFKLGLKVQSASSNIYHLKIELNL